MTLRPILRPVLREVIRSVLVRRNGGLLPTSSDYLLDAPLGNYLTDESGNRLTG